MACSVIGFHEVGRDGSISRTQSRSKNSGRMGCLLTWRQGGIGHSAMQQPDQARDRRMEKAAQQEADSTK